ncbi:ubiquinone/menaquinone biosynthesis methyltransferase [Dictyobacter alpinus]|nr:ubiquinone/menaquinone biosynthesis methyltransferase [Dictyobacter alpinus]
MQRDRKGACQNVFSHIAPIYDRMNFLISFGLIRSWCNRAARYLALDVGEIGLDLGTGTADLAIAVMRISDRTAHMIGIDWAPEMLEQGYRKLHQPGFQDQITLQHGNITSIALPDNSIDRCGSAFLVRNLVNMDKCFREMWRVVRPGRSIVCLEVSHLSNVLLKILFHCYFYRIVPLFGTLLGQKFDAYQYLPASLKHFLDAFDLKKIMETSGWSDVHFYHLHGGLIAIHIGTKRF